MPSVSSRCLESLAGRRTRSGCARTRRCRGRTGQATSNAGAPRRPRHARGSYTIRGWISSRGQARARRAGLAETWNTSRLRTRGPAKAQRDGVPLSREASPELRRNAYLFHTRARGRATTEGIARNSRATLGRGDPAPLSRLEPSPVAGRAVVALALMVRPGFLATAGRRNSHRRCRSSGRA